MRRCQGRFAGTALAPPSAPRATLRPKVTELRTVCHIAAMPAPGAQRRRPHDLVAVGDQPAHGLDRVEVVGAGLQAGPAGAAEPGREAARLAIRIAPSAAQPVEHRAAPPRRSPASPTTPRPQLSQRLTGPARPGREPISPNSGSPQAGQGGFSGPAPASSGTTWVCCLALTPGSVRAVQLSEIMTAGVITSPPEAAAVSVARLMRDHRVGSVVIVDQGDSPVAMVTDRDLAVRVFAEGVEGGSAVGEYASRPLVCGEPAMELDEAAALMVQHRVRRLPVVDAGRLVGIVTLDDIAVRTGNLEVAQRMTAEVIEGALPQFYFHERAERGFEQGGDAGLGGTLGTAGRAGDARRGRAPDRLGDRDRLDRRRRRSREPALGGRTRLLGDALERAAGVGLRSC